MLAIHLAVYITLLSVFLYVSLYVNPRMWIHRMPPEVRSKTGGKSPKDRRQFILFGIPTACIMIFYPAVYAYVTTESLAGCTSTLILFYGGFSVWDTLVLDLLVFAGITPGFIVIEGTDKQDYKNRYYHIRSGIKGLAYTLPASLILGAAIHILR